MNKNYFFLLARFSALAASRAAFFSKENPGERETLGNIRVSG